MKNVRLYFDDDVYEGLVEIKNRFQLSWAGLLIKGAMTLIEQEKEDDKG